MTQPKCGSEVSGNSLKPASAPLGADNDQPSQQRGIDRAFSTYSDAELESLLTDVRKYDEDSFVTVAHSNAVKD